MLDRADWIKIGKGALLAGAAAAATYTLQAIDAFDFGPHEALVTAILSVLFNILRKVKI